MPIAIQEHLLPGATILKQLQHAKTLGLDGVEFWADGPTKTPLIERLPEIAAALSATELRAAAVNVHHTRLIHPDYEVRDAAIARIRQAMTCAVDLGAQGVIFKPFYERDAVLPDLSPYKSSLELEAELLVKQLRATLTDLAYALGTELLIEPVNHTETHLVRRIAHAAVICKQVGDHPHLKVAANPYHMHMEGDEIIGMLRQHTSLVNYVYLTDSECLLPGQGSLDFGAIVHILREVNYTGWTTLAGHPVSTSQPMEQLSNSLPPGFD